MSKVHKQWVTVYLTPNDYGDEPYRLHCTISSGRRGPDYEYAVDSWVFLCDEEIEVAIPDFDIREKLLESLNGEKQKLMAEYAKNMASIEDKISKLLALEVLP